MIDKELCVRAICAINLARRAAEAKKEGRKSEAEAWLIAAKKVHPLVAIKEFEMASMHPYKVAQVDISL